MGKYSRPSKRANNFLEFFGNLDLNKEFPIKVYKSKDKSNELTKAHAEQNIWIMQWSNFNDAQGRPTGVIDTSTIERSSYNLETYYDLFERFQEVGEAPIVQVIKGKVMKVVHDPRKEGKMSYVHESDEPEKKVGRPKKESNVESVNVKG